jgi:hypothetical protein
VANVQLPNINITNDDIDAANLPQLQKIVKALLNTTAILTEELTFLLNNLDTRNVNEIDGDVLIEGTVTALKMQVEELSAISANLGKITAGEIYGTYIATREIGYPKAEMSNNLNTFAVQANANQSVGMTSSGSGIGSPQVYIRDGGDSLLLYQQSGHSLISASDLMTINFGYLILSPGFLGGVRVPFSQFFDAETGTSLRQQLDAKMDNP